MPSLPVPVRLKSEQSRDAAAADVAALQAVAVSFEDAAIANLAGLRRRGVLACGADTAASDVVAAAAADGAGDDSDIDSGENDGNGACLRGRGGLPGLQFGPSSSVSDESSDVCEVCEDGGRKDCIVRCDVCDRGLHMDCMDPKLTALPSGDWMCKKCEQAGHVVVHEKEW